MCSLVSTLLVFLTHITQHLLNTSAAGLNHNSSGEQWAQLHDYEEAGLTKHGGRYD